MLHAEEGLRWVASYEPAAVAAVASATSSEIALVAGKGAVPAAREPTREMSDEVASGAENTIHHEIPFWL